MGSLFRFQSCNSFAEREAIVELTKTCHHFLMSLFCLLIDFVESLVHAVHPLFQSIQAHRNGTKFRGQKILQDLA